MDVSIVIVSFNTSRLLDECIESIKRETRCAYEIIVVDNDSSDDSCRMLKKKHSDVMLIENKNNGGFARANNQGFALGSGKYFLMLNPDTLILNAAIDTMLRFMEQNRDVGICGPRNEGPDGELQHSCDHFPSFWTTLWGYLNFPNLLPGVPMFHRELMRYWDYSDQRDVDIVMGSCLMSRTELFTRLGGLDNDYFMYFEESDYCYRARKSGLRVVYLPFCTIIHYGGESSKKYQKERYLDKKIPAFYYDSKYIFMKKNYGVAAMLLARMLDYSYGTLLVGKNLFRRQGSIKKARLQKGKLLCRAAVKNTFKSANRGSFLYAK